ncbi:hypothetical protein [Absidia glauca]|uniref:[histone H3]-trimethyl-L-lysine(9) demethylase n=1 Tax=Absidia glauca TaxID=4829 RepID=A0A163JXH2_ABSGL|nr:hypothetical protein [Absidia glauca]
MTIKTIQPSEYYDQAHGGRIPVFRPTMPEFEDFNAFMAAIDGYGKAAGVVKVIPPKEWTKQLASIDKQLQYVRVRNPIIQHIMGSQGVYQQTNVEKRRSYTLGQWYVLCQEIDHKPPDPKADRYTRLNPPTTKKRPRRSSKSPQDNKNLYPQPPSANTRSRSKHGLVAEDQTSSPSKRTKRQVEADEIALAQSDDPVPLKFDLHDHNEDLYTSDYCKDLERIYWRNLTFSQPMYGADMAGTLFDASAGSWNVNKLDNVLNQIGVPLPGVNTPYLYFGMWKATFPWHVEDMDLYSINYLHFGAPKQWYAIPGPYNKKFESVMQTTFFQQSRACPEFLRHKTQIASPHFLANNGIPVHRCVQHEGEFMITFPFGYHSGYNLGFNCAESVNFALSSWLDIGRQAKPCLCIADSVTIDMTLFDTIHSTHLSTGRSSQQKSLAATSIKDKSCVLCPSKYPADIKTLEGKMAHWICAESIPDTYMEKVSEGQWLVRGVKNIPAARWKLVCLYCHTKTGACIQCCFGKCYRSFHVSCAKDAGATMENQLVYCPYHDPVLKDKQRFARQRYIDAMTQSLYLGKEVCAKWPGSGYCKGWVQSHVIERRSSRVKFEDGVSRIITWKDIISSS